MQQLADSGQDMDLGNASPAVLQVLPSVFVEIEQLDAIAGTRHRASGVVETSSGRHEPVCNEEVVQWMRDRQASMHDATPTGNAHELTRFCQVMAHAATPLNFPW